MPKQEYQKLPVFLYSYADLCSGLTATKEIVVPHLKISLRGTPKNPVVSSDNIN